jgi:hypothetical protein
MSLGILMGGKSSAKFTNDKNEPCFVSRYYVGNKLRIQIIFSESYSDLAYRPAITSTSESKIVKFLTENNFKLI